MEKVTLRSLAPAGMVGGPFGSSLVSRDYVDDGIPVIRGANMGAGPWLSGDFVYVTPEKFERDLSRNSARAGDLVFTQRGTLGQVVMVPEGGHDVYVVSQSQMRLRVDRAVADPRYVYYACSTASFNKQIADRAISTGVPHINLGILGELTIAGRALGEQRAIAEVLGALDDKIAANTRLVETLDALRRARLQPMLDDAEPQPLSDIAEFVNGRAFTKDATGTGRVVIRIAELNSGLGGSTVYNDIDVDDKHLARPGDLLFAWSGSLTVHRWYRPEGIVNQHIFKVIPKDGYPMWCVNGILQRKLAEFRAIAADKATTMGHIQRRHLDEPVLVPRREVIERESELMSGLWQRALAAEMESERLAATRDALLPLLMSGRVMVKDAESVVEGVV